MNSGSIAAGSTGDHITDSSPFEAWSRQFSSDDRVPLALLSIAWLVACVIMDPRGDFALNDDWAYALMVKRFLSTGRVEPTSWTYTPSVSHVWLGAAFAQAFGLSHTVLRLSGLFMGWLGMIGVYVLARVSGRSAIVAALCAACFGFNPVHLGLAATYMMDVPFATWTTWALVGGVLGFRGRGWGFAVAGVCTLLALSSRQPAVALLPAFVCAAVVGRLGSWRRASFVAAAAVCVGAASIWAYDSYVAAEHAGIGSLLARAFREQRSPSVLLAESVAVWSYLGIGLLPIVPLLPAFARSGNRRVVWWGVILTAVALAGAVRLGLNLPLGSMFNVSNLRGLGVTAMHGLSNRQPLAPSWLWVTAILAVASASCIVLQLAANVGSFGDRKPWRDRGIVLLGAFVAAYVVPTLLRGNFFDRYALPILPAANLLALLLVSGVPSRAQAIAVSTALTLQTVFGVIGTRDYLDHNRTRTALVRAAEDEFGARPEEIEGGFEFNGYQNYNRVLPAITALALAHGQSDGSYDAKRLSLSIRVDGYGDPAVWAAGDRFVVSLSRRIEGYRVVRRRTYFRVLGWNTETQYLHERTVLHQPTPPTQTQR